MTKSFIKAIYKPSTQSTEEFSIMIDPVEYKKWKNGDTSIPLSQVVESFNIYHSIQGSQGILGKPSKQQLDTTFGTSVDVDVIKIILEQGREQSGEIASTTYSLNPTRGSNVSDQRAPRY